MVIILKSIPEEYYCFNCRKRTTNGQTTSNYSIPKLSNLSDEIQHSKFQYNSYHPVRKRSNLNNKSLLKRRIIYGILAVCITLSKTSLASNETENEELSSHSVNETGKIYNHIV